jgi:tetratricopeptide (TPR) repeat protein
MSRPPNRNLSGERASFRHDSAYAFEWSLRSSWRVALFLIPILALSASLAWEVIRVARVTTEIDKLSIIDVQRALSQDPGNTDLIHHLGLVYSLNPTDLNLSEAVKYLRMAVELNPRHWDFWADLGATCDFVGNTTCSDEAFERARVLNPMTPSLQWMVGNHYLLTDREEKAFLYFRALLALDPEYIDPTFRLCMRATRDPEAIYTEVVPHGRDASVRFAFLIFLCSINDYDNAMRIWGQMIAGPDHSPNIALAKPFLDFLIDHNQMQNASVIWNDLQHAGVVPPASNSQSDNLLYDGGFERASLNTGFDWRVNDSPYLVFDFSDPSAYKGAKCVRIEFAVGQNGDDDLLNQVVMVKPSTPYQLTAYVRSESLTSGSGPRLRVAELDCGNCPLRTSDPTLGTTPWHPIDVAFLTGPQTQAVRVSFWRPQDEMYSRDITGTVWLDDVTLRAVAAPGSSVAEAGSR